jgi:REP element-mobilizing transposase RayT
VARRPRDDAAGVVHHVMVRGIERRRIFGDDRDREELLRRLSILVPELGFLCFGWALMPNHFHLLLRSGSTSISRLMARLGTGYARYFNARHDRVGHLFQNRFRSRRAVDDVDLIGLVLYVCRNPLEAGLASEPAALGSYAWCGVGALTGRRPPHPFESVRETLALFDPDPSRARNRLRSWLAIPPEVTPPPRLLDLGISPPTPPRRDRPRAIETVIAETCDRLSVERGALHSRRRSAHIAAARAMVARRAAQELGLTGAEIAGVLGVTPSAVARMLDRAGRERRRPNESTSQ